MEMKVTVTIHKEEDTFVATCEDYNLSARNVTIEDALSDLQKALHQYLEDEELSVSTSILFVIKMPLPI